MKALRFVHNTLSVADLPVPEPSAEALVRVLKSGICNTDLEITRGYAGFEGTIGHEFVGIVERADDAPRLIGKRVVGEINAGCGSCSRCAAGDPRHCPDRTVLGIVGREGAHAEFLQLPSRNLLEVPDAVSDEQAVFAEPLAAAIGITERISIEKGSKVAVIGDGKLGLLCAMGLSPVAGETILVGKHPRKMAIAERAGVRGVPVGDLPPELLAAAEVVIEASGSEAGFTTAVDLVRPQGTIVLKSTFHGSPAWPSSRIVVDEITIVGSRCGRLRPALDLLESGIVNVEELIDAEYSLTAGVEAMHRAAGNGVLKILLKT